MKMMVVDDDAFLLELSRSANATHSIVEMPSRGRNGSKAVPEVIKKLAANDLLEGASAKDIAQAYNISTSSASAYKNGATSTTTYHDGHGELKEFVDGKRDKIKVRAQNKLLSALKHITDDKLAETKVVELSTIAANMARVVEKNSPKEQTVVNNNIVFYSPKQISKENYETIDVSPNDLSR